jgi:putative Mn2+ efflux pump MntP
MWRLAVNEVAIFGLSIGLAMDAFSVAVGAGTVIDHPTLRHYFRIGFHFGLFQFMMPIVGYYAGASLGRWIGGYEHWVAMLLLTVVGLDMIRQSFAHQSVADPTRGHALVILSIATSIDALVVGLGLGFTGAPIVPTSVVIGLTCALFSVIGMLLGRSSRRHLGRTAERLGGLILIAIGLLILIQHMA